MQHSVRKLTVPPDNRVDFYVNYINLAVIPTSISIIIYIRVCVKLHLVTISSWNELHYPSLHMWKLRLLTKRVLISSSVPGFSRSTKEK